MSGLLSGCRVLLTRRRAPDRLALALRQAGAQVETVALTRTVSLPGPVRERAQAHLAAGEAAWLLLTSARTVAHLDLGALHPRTRVGAVGEATAQAAQAALGRPVDLVAGGSASSLLAAAELAEPLAGGPGTSRQVLLPGSALSGPHLAQGLRERGWRVEVLPLYTTQTLPPTELPAGLARRYRAGGYDVVVVTAGSGAQALLALLGAPPAGTVLATLGEPSAQAARALGLPVPPTAVAQQPTPESLVAAVAAVHQPGEQQ